MKKEVTSIQLIVSLFLSLGIMLMINGLIGSMGGISALAGFFCMYCYLRFFYTGKQNCQKETELKLLMIQYGVGYLLIWTGMNVVVVLSRISGWGNIDGISIGEYFSYFFGSTMLERWGYFLAGILMFIFIMSLFPLVIIKRRKVWALYLLGDIGFFVLMCGAVAGICQNFFMNGDRRSRANCVLDNLLMCQMKENWQPILFLTGSILVLILVAVAVYFISKINYGKEETTDKIIFKKENLFIPAIIGILLVSGSVGYFFFGDNSDTMSYHKVAECLTEDNYLGPMAYDGDVYLPVPEEEIWTKELIPLGYLAYKGQNCENRFYELAISNLLYTKKGTLKNSLWMEGAEQNFYRIAQTLEIENSWKEDSIFLLWDEEWESQSSYGAGFTGYTICTRELIDAFRQEYPQVTYNPEDFRNYDAYFTIRGYKEMPDGLEETSVMGDWVGCILVKDNKFYFGSYENPIKGEALQQLLDVLGGYEHSQNMISTQES